MTTDSEELDCPVCFNQLLPPIFQCKNGHLLCTDCIEKLDICPVCRVQMPRLRIRNLIAERSATKNFTACPYRDDGCQLTLKAIDVLKHAKQCEFRGMQLCKYVGFPGCPQEVRGKVIVSHWKAAHDLGSVNIQDGQYTEVVQVGMNQAAIDYGRAAEEWPPLVLLPQNFPPLVLKTTISVDSLAWTISAVYSADHANKLTAEIILLLDEETTSLTWKGPIRNLNMDKLDKNSFSVPISKIRGQDHSPPLLVKISLEPLLTRERQVSDVTIIELGPLATLVQSRMPGVVHPGIWCGGCGQSVNGTRFKCLQCPDFVLCQSCYVDREIHVNKNHVFFALPTPDASSAFETVTNLDQESARDHMLVVAICDGCHEALEGLRFKCTECANFDFCPHCYLQRKLHSHHLFLTAHTGVISNLTENNPLLKGMMHSATMRLIQRSTAEGSASGPDAGF